MCPPPPPPKKKSGTLDFRYFDIRRYSIFWFYQIKHCLLKRMILQPFLETQSFTNFVKSARAIYTAGMAVHKFSLCFVRTDQWAPGNNVWKSEKHYPCLKCHENEEKIDRVMRNDHRIKTTQPISWILVSILPNHMILVSFFSENNVLSDENPNMLAFRILK